MYTKDIPSLTPEEIAHVQSLVGDLSPDGCQRWSHTIDALGYGRICIRGHVLLAHRLVWSLAHGPIPPGMTLDHVRARGCTHKDCVRLDHLELVTLSENVKRQWIHQRKTTQKT